MPVIDGNSGRAPHNPGPGDNPIEDTKFKKYEIDRWTTLIRQFDGEFAGERLANVRGLQKAWENFRNAIFDAGLAEEDPLVTGGTVDLTTGERIPNSAVVKRLAAEAAHNSELPNQAKKLI